MPQIIDALRAALLERWETESWRSIERETGVNHALLSNIVNDKRDSLRLDTIQALADYLGLELRPMKTKRRGFTLIELLIAISIIGLLAGLMLPAVQVARSASRVNNCLSNLHQFSVHISQHTDRRGRMPSLVGAYNQRALQCPEWIAINGEERIDSYLQTGQFQTRESLMDATGLASVDIVICRDRKTVHGDRQCWLYLDGHAETGVPQ